MDDLDQATLTQGQVTAWRRHLHAMPERLYDVFQTSEFVADKLREFGCDIVETGLGKTGVVGLVKGRDGEGRVIGLRADMDALPIQEASGKPWASRISGMAHSCGHDGHTAMLLGAARHLAETRDFAGSVAFIFQPAEEGGFGALAMIEDGLLDRFSIEEVYGMHNQPSLAVGRFGVRKGAIMAGSIEFDIRIVGKGGHAAAPHLARDPVIATAHVLLALQSLVSRETDPLKSLVVTVTMLNGGTAPNVIPDDVSLTGTVRFLLPELQQLAKRRLREIVTATATAHGVSAVVTYRRFFPITCNHAPQTEIAGRSAQAVVGEENVDLNAHPSMGGEDFAFMLERRPGCFIFIGNGDTPDLHNPSYDFNDAAIPHGINYWVHLVETSLDARS